MWGKLGDRLGRKLLLEVALFRLRRLVRRCAARRRTSRSSSCCAQSRVAAAGGLMTLAMATVGDLVAPRERGRYQGYIAATFAVAHHRRPAASAASSVDHAQLALGLPRQPADRRRRLAGLHLRAAGAGRRGLIWHSLRRGRGAAGRRDERSCMLTCIWRRQPVRVGLGRRSSRLAAATVVLSGALLARERRAADPIVPFHLLRTGSVAIASATLFLGTAALFSVTVFVPLFLEIDDGREPTEAGLLLVPAMLGIAVSHDAVRARHRAHGALQALPDRGPGADDRWRSLLPGRVRRRPLAGRHRRRSRRRSAWASAWSRRS